MSRTAADIPTAIIVDLSLLDISSLRYSERVRAPNSPAEFAHHRTGHELRGRPQVLLSRPSPVSPRSPRGREQQTGRGGPKIRTRAEQTAILLTCVIWVTRRRRRPTPAHWRKIPRAPWPPSIARKCPSGQWFRLGPRERERLAGEDASVNQFRISGDSIAPVWPQQRRMVRAACMEKDHEQDQRHLEAHRTRRSSPTCGYRVGCGEWRQPLRSCLQGNSHPQRRHRVRLTACEPWPCVRCGGTSCPETGRPPGAWARLNARFSEKAGKNLPAFLQCTSRRIGLASVSTTRASSPRLRS